MRNSADDGALKLDRDFHIRRRLLLPGEATAELSCRARDTRQQQPRCQRRLSKVLPPTLAKQEFGPEGPKVAAI